MNFIQLHCFQLCCQNFLLLISKFCFFKDPLLELAYLSNLIIGNLSTCVLKFPYFRVQLLYIRTTFLFNEIMVNIKSNTLVYGTMPSITLLVLKGIFLSQFSVSEYIFQVDSFCLLICLVDSLLWLCPLKGTNK